MGMKNRFAISPLASQITFKSNGLTRMTTTTQYDYFHPVRYRADDAVRPPEARVALDGSLLSRGLSRGVNRLTAISSSPSSSSSLSFNYTYNAANQRTKNVLADGSYWIYGYDSLAVRFPRQDERRQNRGGAENPGKPFRFHRIIYGCAVR
jgi:hypothetical protein